MGSGRDRRLSSRDRLRRDESWLTPAVSSTDGPLRGCGWGNQRLRLSFHTRKRTLQASSDTLRRRWALNCYLFHYNGPALRIVRALNGFLYLSQGEPISIMSISITIMRILGYLPIWHLHNNHKRC